MSRKVFISFLGATNYGPCDYQIAGKSFGKERFIQVSTLRMLTQSHKWTSADIAYILLTKEAESNNWVDEGHIDQKTNEKIKGLKGLCSDLNRLKEEIGPEYFPKIEPIRNIPVGNNEDEIWTIFDKIFEKLEKDDELYFDITHGYRYLPMLTLVLVSYARFIKGVSVKSITYGNYEISHYGKYPGIIVNLLPLAELQDWTFAAGQYVNNGEVNDLVRLSKKDKSLDTAMNYLAAVVEERQTIREKEIISSASLKSLKEALGHIDKTKIPPLKHILDKIEDSLKEFDENENVKNGYSAAKWCIHNHLYQQGITILEETMFTDVCIKSECDWNNIRCRNAASGAFAIYNYHIRENRWKYDSNDSDEQKEETKRLYKLMINILSANSNNYLNVLYKNVVNLRNDFNHAGMSNNSLNSTELIKEIANLTEDIPC